MILDVDLANGMGPARDVDDGLALALALTSPEVELLGCTTCAGNCRTSESTRQTLLFLEQAGRTDIPVAEGREEPLLADHRANFEYYDQRSAGFIGEETLWPETAQSWDLLHPGPTTEKSPLKAHDFIIEMVQRYPGEVTIIKEGSLTNLAMALLVEPSIAGKVKEVIRKSARIVRLGFFPLPEEAAACRHGWQLHASRLFARRWLARLSRLHLVPPWLAHVEFPDHRHEHRI